MLNGLFRREKSVKFSVYPVADLLEVLRSVLELDSVDIEDQKATLVVLDPVLIPLVQTGQVVYPYALFLFAAALLYLGHDIRNRRSEIYHQIRRIDQGHHQVEEVGIVLEIAGGHQPHAVEIRSEDTRILVDGPVLDDDVLALGDIHHILEPFVEEINLEIKGPTLHIFVEISEIRIKVHGLEFRGPSVMGCEQPRQRGLAASNVSGYCNVHGSVVDIFAKIEKVFRIFAESRPKREIKERG